MNRLTRLVVTVICFGAVATLAKPVPTKAMGFPCHGCSETCADAERWCNVYCGLPANEQCFLDTYDFCEGSPFIWIVGCEAPE